MVHAFDADDTDQDDGSDDVSHDDQEDNNDNDFASGNEDQMDKVEDGDDDGYLKEEFMTAKSRSQIGKRDR